MTKYSIQEYYCSLNFTNEQHNVKYIKQELPDLKKKKKATWKENLFKDFTVLSEFKEMGKPKE